ncbi:sigma-w pathway protein ysdB [Shouchella clausii]|uniref:Sigma-w pathway protein ysdB n=1 Tax=Shouchella clausii TaxID=79880 RepID=A0A268S2M4_SHOCL|nr:sigma-w pathway protein ysdB [Shouchella clausii]PAD42592.1 sigma-w pathway protein ysdB [Bacillus sp. 7520-S]SPU21887.1 YsdB [Niallia circulans]AST97043.1 sigma-w pathway protein ysdB [Shouchella clausii]MBU8594581.1 sigma-w pathway protein ysdB [Shouchella clausii]MCM3547458.1 sigma-w pathway protein ysdB [Shouchella clausii]
MLVLIFRLLIVATIVVISYSLIKYTLQPERKLKKAQNAHQFYFLDDSTNVRKNFQLTFKGIMFEGEKYLEATKESFEVIRVYIKADTDRLRGLTFSDFHFIEEEVLLRYPEATIEWASPIKEFMKQAKQPEER